jgi:DNA-binding transcriptional MerR regulator
MSLLIHTVAKEANLSIETVKRAEKRGLISSQRDCNGWRRFAPDAVEKLKLLYGQGDGNPSPEPQRT